MTTDTQLAPTDAEIDALNDQFRWDATTGRRAIARAVLARWGAPAPVGVEPVARLEIGKTKGGVSLTHIAEPAAFQLPEGMYALYTAPQPTQSQAGAAPLTDEWIRSRCKESWIFDTAKQWVRMTEVAHGIKQGGQHGTE